MVASKAKARAAATARQKAQARAQGNKFASPVKKPRVRLSKKQAEFAGEEVHPMESSEDRRRHQFARRDTDDQVDRAIKRNLTGVISKAAISTRRGKITGDSIREYLAKEIRSRRSSKQKLGPKFWEKMYAEFDIQGVTLELADPPSDDDEAGPSDELLQFLGGAHSENPIRAATGVLALERYLQHMPEVGATAMYGILQACQPQPTMPHASSMKALVAVLHYWQRT